MIPFKNFDSMGGTTPTGNTRSTKSPSYAARKTVGEKNARPYKNLNPTDMTYIAKYKAAKEHDANKSLNKSPRH